MGWYQRRVHGESSPVTQSNPCCSSATPLDLPFDLATPERVLRPPLIPSLVSVSSLLLSPKQRVNPSQDGHVQDQAELPRRLRGFDQQADQHGILRLLRLSLHVFQDIAKPVSMEWGTCLEAMEAALELEKMVNQSLLELTKAAEAKGDSHLSDFVDEFLEGQVASIKSIGDTITKLKRVGDGLGLFLFDKEMAA